MLSNFVILLLFLHLFILNQFFLILSFFEFQASIEICLEENEENGSNYFRPIQTAAYTPAQRNSAEILKLKRGYEIISFVIGFFII